MASNNFPADLMDLANMSADSDDWDANSILQGTLLDPALPSTRLTTPPQPRSSTPAPTGVGVGSTSSPAPGPSGINTSVGVGSSSPRPGPSGINTRVGVGAPSNGVRTTTVGRLPSGKRIPTGRPAPRPVSVGKQPRNHAARGRGRPRGRPRGSGRRSTAASSARQATASRTARSTGRGRMTQAELRRQLDLLSQDQVQEAAGRRIAGVTTTNTVTTTYKDGARPTVRRTQSSVRN